MANIRLIRRRIRSVQNTAKITKAMEMIAASKMKRAQERALAGRPYADKILQVLADIVAVTAVQETPHPLLARRLVNNIEIIHITGDRGLCGGLNANMNRKTGGFMLEKKEPTFVVTVGKKGRDFMVRTGRDVHAEFIGLGDRPSSLEVVPISRVVIDDYTNGEADVVYLAYTKFVNTAVQRPVLEQLLPVEPTEFPPARRVDYIYEPDARSVLSQLLPRFVEMKVYHAILEHIASEQSARMVAMRAATDNANDLIQELTLTYNKARQEMITKELLDIVGGAAALEM